MVQILTSFESVIGKSIVLNSVNDIKGEIFAQVFNLPYYITMKYDRGELLNRIEFDAATIVGYYMDLVSGRNTWRYY